MADSKITRRDFPLVFERPTTEVHKIIVTRFIGYILEMEDLHFHHDSAVLLADFDIEQGMADRITALSILACALDHARSNPARKLLIAGHTDTSGSDSYNLGLSQQRAENVLACLTGDRAAFTKICLAKSKVEDYQQILKWVSVRKSWPCDPGAIDNDHGGQTSTALQNFKKSFNAEKNANLPITGTCDKATWDAFFDLYEEQIAEAAKVDVPGLATLRSGVKWVDSGRKTVGCGENWPIEGIGADNYRSAVNRRVELLFFDPGNEPVLECHPSPTACKPTECELYWTKCFKHVPIPVKPVNPVDALLDITRVDDHFAPQAESLDIEYTLKNLEGKPVTLEISSPHADANPLFTRELTDPEKTTGTHTIQWDGKPTAGALKDLFIHPLWSPYTVTLKSGGLSDKEEFKVLYHSLEVKQGPWTPDETEPPDSEDARYVAYRLNELGYWGGPVGHDFDDYLEKAIIRYRANHKDFHKTFIKDYVGSIDAALKAALKAGDNPFPGFETAALSDPAATSKIFLEALTYERTTATTTEFGAKERQPFDAKRMNRPIVPLEAVIYLKTKADAGAIAPEATGPVRVNWKFTDPDEDLSGLPDDSDPNAPSKTNKYVEKALKLKSGRTGSNGDNTHKDFGGIRTALSSYYKQPWVDGTRYEPYKVEDDSGNKTVFVRASVDKAKFPKRLGRSGILFRPSTIAGDSYKLKAEIDFTGEKNKADLEKFHNVTDEASRPHVDLGTFQIWRRNRVALAVHWPAATKNRQWAEIHTEFANAYLDVNTTGVPTKKVTEVLTEADYKAIVIAKTANKDASKITLKETSICGVDVPAQSAGELEADYRRRATKFCNDFWDAINGDCATKIGEFVRKTDPTGFILAEFHSSDPLPLNDDAGNAIAPFIPWTFSIGLPDSFCFLDEQDPDKIYYVVAHEMGHNLYLRHHENAGGSSQGDHDTSEHNCLMSYSSSSSGFAFQAPGTFSPRLCGKCNLKLRGWKIGTLPAGS